MTSLDFGLLALFTGLAGAYSQKLTVNAIIPSETGNAILLVAGGAMIRLAIYLVVLFFAFRQGMLPGMVALAGLLIGRWIVILGEQLKE